MNKISSPTLKRFLAAAALALAVPLTVSAAPGPQGDCAGMESRGAHGKRAGGMERMAQGGSESPMHALRGVNLSEVQRDKVFEIMHAQAPVMRERAKAEQKANEELRKLAAAPDYSEAKARALSEAIGKAAAEAALARVKVDRQIADVLTPEQRKQLAEAKTLPDAPRSPVGEGRNPPPVR
ncbi:Spy/CpxP family protein refolding chaperone [Quatrionicoccus australiensis]|uniref:Spy/CpxP family protein refolding chaperone n=1 Tax=Quatrionicoccus australiensis TaxID=138118 RepID=UPI001CFB1A2F|nr:Spy/CpxP family protein refolding chaperone [Quatrionicoccus australiensis]MCB4359794.1 Spy/CpxP family protein refolding chaperone [Quatrionicoccus australiensis]